MRSTPLTAACFCSLLVVRRCDLRVHCVSRVVCSVRAGSVLSHCGGASALRGSVRRVCLFLCGRLSDAELRPLESFLSLTAVDLGGCHALTDEALRFISASPAAGTGEQSADKRRKLQWLSLYWCPGLTDKVGGKKSATTAHSVHGRRVLSLTSLCCLCLLFTARRLPRSTAQGINYLSAGLDCSALRHLSFRSAHEQRAVW